jgi:hypothetical protein
MCLKGLRATDKPTLRERSQTRLQFRRKAAFFAVAAAEAMSEIDGDTPDDRASAMWVHASKMLSEKGNKSDGGNYGWATLRAVALHGLAMQGVRASSEDAAVQLLSLMSEISSAKPPSKESVLFFSKVDALETEESNTINVPADYGDNGRLANWIKRQKRQYRLFVECKVSSFMFCLLCFENE